MQNCENEKSEWIIYLIDQTLYTSMVGFFVFEHDTLWNKFSNCIEVAQFILSDSKSIGALLQYFT